MIRTIIAAALLLAVAPPAHARDCYDLGHAGRCRALHYRTTQMPRRSLLAEMAHGSRASDDLMRRVNAAAQLRGSGMGPRGMVGRCGGGTCPQ